MKKVFLFLSAAAMLTVACNKSETVNNAADSLNSNQIAFKAISSNVTKGEELSGTLLKDGYGIYAAAAQKSANGIIENASYFAGGEQLFKNADGTVIAETLWKAYDGSAFAPVYWPMGGDALLDFLAYAEPIAKYSSVDGEWKVVFDYPSTDISKQFTITAVDTYAHQSDFMYASVQNQSKAVNGGTGNSVKLDFSHAQALLIFNVKVNDAAEAAGLAINKIMFINDARLQQLRAKAQSDQATAPLHAAWEAKKVADGYDSMSDGQKTDWDAANPEPVAADLAAITDDQVTLKTIGTFCVNNERVELVASWSALASDADNYLMPNGVTAMSEANSQADGAKVFDYEAALTEETNLHQLGETLLIPQQEKVNFVIEYVAGGKTMYYKYNDLRGIWEMGKKYIYNLDIALEEIVITESVADYTEVAYPVAL